MGGAEGWFWYETPPLPPKPEPEKKKEEKPSLVIKAPDEDKKDAKSAQTVEPFSVQWLRSNMPILLDRAIDNPTQENVEAYEYAKRVMLDKSQRYAEKTRDVVSNDPFLDENNRVPFATFAKKAFLTKRQSDVGAALKYLSEKVGLWLFFDSTCNFCHLQARQILELQKTYGFHTRFISMNGKGMPMLPEYYINHGQAKALGLTMTPTTVMVVPPNGYYIISQGAMAMDQLQERIMVAADSRGLLPKEMKDSLDAFDKGVLTAEDTKDIESDDPKVWVAKLKEKLKGRY